MKFINYISLIAMPLTILVIVFESLKERKSSFDIFLKGGMEGSKIILRIFPTLVGLFVSIGMLRGSGVIEFLIGLIKPLTDMVGFPNQIIPLAILRPISGSASIAVATDIMKSNGVDSFTGILASVIMGSTETTIYTIAVYTSAVNVKDTRKILIPALLADITGILISFAICKIMF